MEAKDRNQTAAAPKSGRITRRRRGGPARRSRPRTYARQWSVDATTVASDLRPPSYRKLSEAPAAAVERATLHKLPWIIGFINRGCPRGQLRACAEAHAEAHGIPTEEIPPYTTMREWVRRYRAFGPVGLIDKPSPYAGRSRALSSPDANRVRLAVVGGKMTSPAAVTSYVVSAPTGGSSVKYPTVRREIERLKTQEPHLVTLATEGALAFRNGARLAIPQELKPGGDTLLIDSTVADLFIRVPDANWPDGWAPMRPALSVAEDEGSRLFVTFNLSLTAITSGVILGMFRRAVLPEYNYDGLVSVGIPRSVSADKGAEHRAKFLETLRHLNVAVAPRLPNSPQGGARVERIIGTITREVLSNLRGYSPTQKSFNPYAPDHADTKRSLRQLAYDPYRLELPVTSLLTYEELEAAIVGWGTVYNSRPHRSLSSDDAAVVRVIEGAKQRRAYLDSVGAAS